MTITQIKALFQTGKIPTQADFENLINKIPNNDSMEEGDNTLNLTNPSNPNVLGYRFINSGDTGSYMFIGFYDAVNATYLPYIIIHCNTDSPSKYDNTPPVRYAILTSEMMMEMLSRGGNLHSVTDSELIEAIPSNIRWNWVGWNCLSDTHRVIKNDLVEEHFFITTDGSTIAYLKVVYATETGMFPIVSKVIRVETLDRIVTIYNYIPTSITNIDDYKQGLVSILDSVDLSTTQLLNFINKYMKEINVKN